MEKKNKINPLHVAVIRELMKKKVGRSQYLSIFPQADGSYKVTFRGKYQESYFVKIDEGHTYIKTTFIRDTELIKKQKEDLIEGLKLKYSMARNGIEIKLVDGYYQLTGNTFILSDTKINKINTKLEQLDEMEAIICSK